MVLDEPLEDFSLVRPDSVQAERAWVSLAQGVLNFTPDSFLSNFKPRELTSQTISSTGAASPPYELWGAYTEQNNFQCTCPGVQGTNGGGFSYYQVNSDWTLNPSYTVTSHLRCMPDWLLTPA
jgi:hypothetical protein